MASGLKPECSFLSWYPQFRKHSLEATILHIPNEVVKYLQHDAFILPFEARTHGLESAKWTDGSPVVDEEPQLELEPMFQGFSRKIQDIIDDYGAVFIKCNWSSPSDATWVVPTKTLKCKTLEDIYLLLKSSDRIMDDLNNVRNYENRGIPLKACLVLKKWQDINPCTEFRCFVIENELTAISQRDISQYHSYNESEKYNIQTDIESLFMERIKDRFLLNNYSFDVVRNKKNETMIVDFGTLDESATDGTLFTYEELQNKINDTPEFRFIGEEIGIQPKSSNYCCIPQEISEFFQWNKSSAFLDIIQRKVESQQKEGESTDADALDNV
ncbi:cell division cycle protein 123 homolog isoform X2 [Colletes gigas]|nr:cell division cycle protein 123 homolog isoform X2 [Colletes gigas]XP_043253439.1 cell division cycle protein 123 homolog isoform X2 [Colletes gigas]